MIPKLIPGGIYQSNTHGSVEYIGSDTFYGQTTAKFKALEYGQYVYKFYHEIDNWLEKPQRTGACIE